MTIRPGLPGFPYTESGIRANAPSAPGLYAIFNEREWIYIGETDNLQRQLLTHVKMTDDEIARSGPTRFSFEVVYHAELRGPRQHALIAELRPRRNEVPA